MVRIPCLLIAAVVFLAACDSVTPVDESRLVVHAFLETGRPLPTVVATRTLSPSRPYDADEAAVTNASIALEVGGRVVPYAPDSSRGTYAPADTRALRPGERFSFRASWNGIVATASGTVPPTLSIADVVLDVPEEPVSAVLLDSLALVDSLTTGLYTGYIYPIDVTVTWQEAETAGWSVEDSWIRAQLKPISTFSSPVVELFLRSEEIFREAEQESSDGLRTWTGVYAVGVAEADDPLPAHRLRVALIRSDEEYARYAASKDAPERREPISNVSGGIGIVAAMALDSTSFDVPRAGSRR